VSVTYFVDFKKLKAIGGLLPTNPFHSSAKDSLFGLSVSPGSYVRFYTGMDDDGNRWEQKYASARQLNFILKQPVQSTEPVGEVKFEHENVGAQAVGVVANMAFRSMGMSGLKPARRVREYELMVNPDSYNSQASKVLQAVNTMMVNMIRDEANVTAQAAPAQE
jgi:hypothetical protein